jgi:hypothetical protein
MALSPVFAPELFVLAVRPSPPRISWQYNSIHHCAKHVHSLKEALFGRNPLRPSQDTVFESPPRNTKNLIRCGFEIRSRFSFNFGPNQLHPRRPLLPPFSMGESAPEQPDRMPKKAGRPTAGPVFAGEGPSPSPKGGSSASVDLARHAQTDDQRVSTSNSVLSRVAEALSSGTSSRLPCGNMTTETPEIESDYLQYDLIWNDADDSDTSCTQSRPAAKRRRTEDPLPEALPGTSRRLQPPGVSTTMHENILMYNGSPQTAKSLAARIADALSGTPPIPRVSDQPKQAATNYNYNFNLVDVDDEDTVYEEDVPDLINSKKRSKCFELDSDNSPL